MLLRRAGLTASAGLSCCIQCAERLDILKQRAKVLCSFFKYLTFSLEFCLCFYSLHVIAVILVLVLLTDVKIRTNSKPANILNSCQNDL